MDRANIAAYLVVVAAAVGASKISTNHATSSLRHAENLYVLVRHKDRLHACERVVADRRTQISYLTADATGNLAIAHDPFQSAVTRAARLKQAKVEEAAVASYMQRVPPKLSCEAEAGPLVKF